jgi:hypothetical protein
VRFALINAMKFAISVLAMAAACLAQEGLTIDNKHKERVSTPEAEKIYFSACSVVREEFDVKTPILPRVKLVLDTSKNGVLLDEREVRLTRWDPYLFAQGVVMLAFADIMTGGPQNGHDEASHELGRFNRGNRTTCKVADWPVIRRLECLVGTLNVGAAM